MRLDCRPPIDICETCGSGQGYLWPQGHDEDHEHMYVQRCDNCERFTSDDGAFIFVRDMLAGEGHIFETGTKFIHGSERPWIDYIPI